MERSDRKVKAEEDHRSLCGMRKRVVCAYLGGLAVSSVVGADVKLRHINRIRVMDCQQKSGYRILEKRIINKLPVNLDEIVEYTAYISNIMLNI